MIHLLNISSSSSITRYKYIVLHTTVVKSAISSIQFRVHSEFDVDFVDADEFYDDDEAIDDAVDDSINKGATEDH